MYVLLLHLLPVNYIGGRQLEECQTAKQQKIILYRFIVRTTGKLCFYLKVLKQMATLFLYDIPMKSNTYDV